MSAEDPRAVALRYLRNRENRGVFEREQDIGRLASRVLGPAAGDPAAFVLGPHFREHGRRALAEVAAAWEPHLARPATRVLDAGCGPGVSALALAERYGRAEVLALDVEAEALALARLLAGSHPRVAFRQAPLESLEDPEGFDLIQCRAVLEHVYEPRRALTALLRALRPGGVLYVETPNYWYPWEPHLLMPMLPKSPRRLLRAQARLTGRDPAFVDHLNLEVDPVTLRRWARTAEPGVEVVDLVAAKARRMLLERSELPVVASRARVVAAVRRSPSLARGLAAAIARAPLAPSAILLFKKPA